MGKRTRFRIPLSRRLLRAFARTAIAILLLFASSTPLGITCAAEEKRENDAAASPANPVTVTEYFGMCGASASVAVGTNRFLVADDEQDTLRLYEEGKPNPVRLYQLAAQTLSLWKSHESDIEAAARIEDKAYWISSHGRDSDGRVSASRHRLFVTRLREDGGTLSVEPVGTPYTHLLEDLLAAPQLAKYNLAAAAKLSPKKEGGLNIEGLAAMPGGRLLLGFRSPLPHKRALLVPINNPGDLASGQKRAVLGIPVELDLRGKGIRDILWDGNVYWILAGDAEGNGRFHLSRWKGPGHAARRVDFDFPKPLHPEACAFFPATTAAAAGPRLLVLSDDGKRTIDGCDCNDLRSPSAKRFRSVVVDLAPWVKPARDAE